MGELAIHPPVHVVTHPDEPIRSLEAAARFVERHGKGDPAAAVLLNQLRAATTVDAADAAGMAFRAWAKTRGLLLVPPEDAPESLGKSAID